jgi:NAD(P)H-dependent FMN reductase
MIRIGIILGSTRPSRNGEQVARWVYDRASRRNDAEFELIDLRDYPLPHLDEPLPPSLGRYQREHNRAWAGTIASFDGSSSSPPSTTTLCRGAQERLDYLHTEWANKAAGIVSYGGLSGIRAAEQLRLICGALQMADVTQQVALSLHTEFENYTTFKPADHTATALDALLDQVIAWSAALAPLRAAPLAAA